MSYTLTVCPHPVPAVCWYHMPSIPEPQFPEPENGITMPTAQHCEEKEMIEAHETPHGCPGQEK